MASRHRGDHLQCQAAQHYDGQLYDYTSGVTAVTFTNTGLTNGTTYYYVVTAVNSAGESANSVQATASPLAAPTGLKATRRSSSRIDLSWTDTSSNESGFTIERSMNGVNWTQITTVGANIKSYQNTGLSAGQTYYYRVRAYNGNGSGNSNYSNTVSAKT